VFQWLLCIEKSEIVSKKFGFLPYPATFATEFLNTTRKNQKK